MKYILMSITILISGCISDNRLKNNLLILEPKSSKKQIASVLKNYGFKFQKDLLCLNFDGFIPCPLEDFGLEGVISEPIDDTIDKSVIQSEDYKELRIPKDTNRFNELGPVSIFAFTNKAIDCLIFVEFHENENIKVLKRYAVVNDVKIDNLSIEYVDMELDKANHKLPDKVIKVISKGKKNK